jgi:ATP-binding protein involved in chromosome partitioning
MLFGKPDSRVTKDTVLAALKQVQEPELHRDLVTLNMIRDIQIEGNDVAFTVVPARCAHRSNARPRQQCLSCQGSSR